MKITNSGQTYQLQHLESKGHETLNFVQKALDATDDVDDENANSNKPVGTSPQLAIKALIDRTKYLNQVLPCEETVDATYHLEQALHLYDVLEPSSLALKIIEPGHVYQLQHTEGDKYESLSFIKRSSGAIDYKKTEHPGTNTQEALRALIDHTESVDHCIGSEEMTEALYHLRKALYLYEVRAYRRKEEKLNKKSGEHDSPDQYDASREDYLDIPFSEHEIEYMPVSEDGHVIYKDPFANINLANETEETSKKASKVKKKVNKI